MWLQTNVGFFSLAEKAQSIDREQLTIRARVRSDLEALQMIYLPGLTQMMGLMVFLRPRSTKQASLLP
jgi:hypothetical protein